MSTIKLARKRSKATLRDSRKDERRAYTRAIRRAGKAECRACKCDTCAFAWFRSLD